MDTGRKCNLLDFTDSNWYGDKDGRKSTTGYIFMFGGTPISQFSNKELVVALSDCEAEYNVALLCVCQVVWLMNLLKELGINEGKVVTLLINTFLRLILLKTQLHMGGASTLRRGFTT